MPLLIDAHLDLAWNALSFNRDQTWAVDQIRESEAGMTDEPSRGRNTVSLPEMRQAGIGLCVATLLVRSGLEQDPRSNLSRTDLEFATPSIAHATAHGQLAYYRLLERQGEVCIIDNVHDLQSHWKRWQQADVSDWNRLPIGLLISMEGADPIVTPADIGHWYNVGLRAIGPAHYGQSHYAGGTGCDSGLTDAGKQLLAEMQAARVALDVTHLCDRAFDEAFDHFEGIMWASHHNCRSLVPGERQLTDSQIVRLIERNAVIGTALDAWMLHPDWIKDKSDPSLVSLAAVADHIDHVCQLAGNSLHAAIGSDLDGGFGTEQSPHDLSSICDLQRTAELLDDRGYSASDIDAIFHGNWLRTFSQLLAD